MTSLNRTESAHAPMSPLPVARAIASEGTDSADPILAFPSSRSKTAGREKRGGEGMNVLEENNRRPMRILESLSSKERATCPPCFLAEGEIESERNPPRSPFWKRGMERTHTRNMAGECWRTMNPSPLRRPARHAVWRGAACPPQKIQIDHPIMSPGIDS